MAIIFLHIPKTAGQSIRAAIEERFGEERCYIHGKTAPWRDFDSRLSSMDQYDFIGGHLTMEQIGRIPGEHKIFMIVREPVARLLSWYEFLSRARRAALHPWTTEGDMHSFIERCCELRRRPHKPDHNAMEMFNGMCRRLDPNATAEVAQSIIRGNGILAVDQACLGERLPQLSEFVGLDLQLPRLNVTKEKPRYPQSVIERLRELNHEDIKLHQSLVE